MMVGALLVCRRSLAGYGRTPISFASFSMWNCAGKTCRLMRGRKGEGWNIRSCAVKPKVAHGNPQGEEERISFLNALLDKGWGWPYACSIPPIMWWQFPSEV